MGKRSKSKGLTKKLAPEVIGEFKKRSETLKPPCLGGFDREDELCKVCSRPNQCKEKRRKIDFKINEARKKLREKIGNRKRKNEWVEKWSKKPIFI